MKVHTYNFDRGCWMGNPPAGYGQTEVPKDDLFTYGESRVGIDVGEEQDYVEIGPPISGSGNIERQKDGGCLNCMGWGCDVCNHTGGYNESQ